MEWSVFGVQMGRATLPQLKLALLTTLKSVNGTNFNFKHNANVLMFKEISVLDIKIFSAKFNLNSRNLELLNRDFNWFPDDKTQFLLCMLRELNPTQHLGFEKYHLKAFNSFRDAHLAILARAGASASVQLIDIQTHIQRLSRYEYSLLCFYEFKFSTLRLRRHSVNQAYDSDFKTETVLKRTKKQQQQFSNNMDCESVLTARVL